MLAVTSGKMHVYVISVWGSIHVPHFAMLPHSMATCNSSPSYNSVLLSLSCAYWLCIEWHSLCYIMLDWCSAAVGENLALSTLAFAESLTSGYAGVCKVYVDMGVHVYVISAVREGNHICSSCCCVYVLRLNGYDALGQAPGFPP